MKERLKDLCQEFDRLVEKAISGQLSKARHMRATLVEIWDGGGHIALGYNGYKAFCAGELSCAYLYFNHQKVMAEVELCIGVPLGTYLYRDTAALRKGIKFALGGRNPPCACVLPLAPDDDRPNPVSELRARWQFVCDRSASYPPSADELKKFSAEYLRSQGDSIPKAIAPKQNFYQQKAKELEAQIRELREDLESTIGYAERLRSRVKQLEKINFKLSQKAKQAS